MKTNTATRPIHNHEGVVARHINPELQLRRSVMSCMLWEDEFYEDGHAIAERIAALIPLVAPEKVAGLAIEAREKMKLRHVPLLIVREMARAKVTLPGLVRKTLAQVIQRPDELAEFLSIYWKEKRQPLAKQVQRGLADAFKKFDAYALAKYNRDAAIKLRDVAFLVHAKPNDAPDSAVKADPVKKARYARGEVLRHVNSTLQQLIDGTLPTPDTWEVALSAGVDKTATWIRLIDEKKLGALAMLRNLRNMQEAKVPIAKIRQGLQTMKTERVLPFRFISAARHAPNLEPDLEPPMFRCLEGRAKIPGKTVLLVDNSPSMDEKVSGKSELSRKDAANGLAIIVRELCEEVEIWSFSSTAKMVPSRRGFALADAIRTATESNGTLLGSAIQAVSGRYDRLIVITDEQSQDAVGNPDAGKSAYLINVASAKNGVGYGPWTHIDGWSEAIVDYIQQSDEPCKG